MIARRSGRSHGIAARLAAVGAVGTLISLSVFLPANAASGLASAAANNGLTIAPASGSTLADLPTFNVAAPGCTGTATSTTITIAGPGVTGENNDGSKNMLGAEATTVGAAISRNSGSVSWDGFAIALSLPRPLNGTYTIKVQCVEDGDATGQAFFDREVTFVGTGAAGSNGTWTAVGPGGGGGGTTSPTPTPVATPTPTPAPGGATPTPVPTEEATPTPEPDGKEECDPTLEDCTETEGEDDDNAGGGGGGGDNLPNSGGRDPGDAMTIAALSLFSGLLFMALTVEGPRPGRHDQDGTS